MNLEYIPRPKVALVLHSTLQDSRSVDVHQTQPDIGVCLSKYSDGKYKRTAVRTCRYVFIIFFDLGTAEDSKLVAPCNHSSWLRRIPKSHRKSARKVRDPFVINSSLQRRKGT